MSTLSEHGRSRQDPEESRDRDHLSRPCRILGGRVLLLLFWSRHTSSGMPEDREARNSALVVQNVVESNPEADWTLKCIHYDATAKESVRFRKGTRLREGFIDVLEYDRNVTRGNCKAQTSLYPPMYRKNGCMSCSILLLIIWLEDSGTCFNLSSS